MTSQEGGPRRRTLEITREIEAPPEAVWKALSEAEGLRRWFPLDARVVPGAGGSVWLSWGPGCEGEAPIHAWEPGRRLGWTEEYPDGSDGVVRVAVDFHVEGRGGSTVVRLVQSGFGEGEDWDDHYHGVEGGWTYFLFNLEWYLERHAGKSRRMVWVRHPTTRLRRHVWPTLLGPGGLGLVDAGVPPEPGGSCRLVLDGEPVAEDGRITMVRGPMHFAAVFPSLDDAPLFVELEGSGPARWHCGVWLSTYGLPSERVDALQHGLDGTMDRALPD